MILGTVPAFAPDFARQCGLQEPLRLYHPLYIHDLRSVQKHRETVVDIACKNRSESHYSGDQQLRQSVELKFGDFIDYYQACFIQQSHWLHSVEDLDFYLCQCPIATYESDSTSSGAKLPHLMDDFITPACLQQEDVTQVNVWMTVKPSETTLHYDAYKNILVVLYGQKTVTLYPPSDTSSLDAYPVYSTSPNHVQPSSYKRERGSSSGQVFHVKAGDALFIPEGWWHQVHSAGFTIAINYWFSGMRKHLLAASQSLPYYARVLVEAMVHAEHKRVMAEQRQTCRTEMGLGKPVEADRVVHEIMRTDAAKRREQCLMALDDRNFDHIQRLLLENHKKILVEVIQNASDIFATYLTDSWEKDDGSSSCASEVLALFDDESVDIRAVLTRKKECFRQHLCQRVLHQTLGVYPVDNSEQKYN